MINSQQNVLEKIAKLKKQLNKISKQIERERFESNEDDTVILQELLDKKGMIEAQLLELEEDLSDFTQNKPSEKTYNLEINGGKKTLTVVNKNNVDPSIGHISHDSPLAKALFGRKKGDRITIETPAGMQDIVIKNIQ